MKWKLVTGILIGAILIGGIGFYAATREKNPHYETSNAIRGTISEEVSVTGKVKATEEIELAFERSGKISNIAVKTGENVIKGQILLELDKAELIANLEEAEANRDAAFAKLTTLKLGARKEEVEIQKTTVLGKEHMLQDAEQALINAIQDAYTKSDDAIRDKLDAIIDNPQSSNPSIIPSALNTQLREKLEKDRIHLGLLLTDWYASIAVISDSTKIEIEKNRAIQNLASIKLFADNFAVLASGFLADENTSQTTIDTYRTNISVARTNIANAITNLTSAIENARTAETNLLIAKQELLLLEAGATSEEIVAEEALLKQTEAKILSFRAELMKATLRSPIDGIVTNHNAKIGAIIALNTPIISVFSKNSFEIEAHIPEADITKIAVGNLANVTLDAYGSSRMFSVRIIFIDPAETVIEGVTTYRTTFMFLDPTDDIKSGMTANLDIETNRRENVILVPSRAVLQKNGDQIVRVLIGKTLKEVLVTTGLRSLDGMTEIKSGINDGDKIITFVEE